MVPIYIEGNPALEYNVNYTFDESGEAELNLNITKVKEKFPELAVQIYTGDYLRNINRDKSGSVELELKTSGYLDSISVRCIYNDGSGFERNIAANSEYNKVLIPLSETEQTKYALLPRPYPIFLPYWFESIPPENKSVNIRLESIQFAIPLDNIKKEDLSEYGIKLKKINYIE